MRVPAWLVFLPVLAVVLLAWFVACSYINEFIVRWMDRRFKPPEPPHD